MNDREGSFASHFLTEGSHLAQSHPMVDFLSGIGSSAAKADNNQTELTGVYCGHGAALCGPGFQYDWTQGEVGFWMFKEIPGPSQRADHSGELFGCLA